MANLRRASPRAVPRDNLVHLVNQTFQLGPKIVHVLGHRRRQVAQLDPKSRHVCNHDFQPFFARFGRVPRRSTFRLVGTDANST